MVHDNKKKTCSNGPSSTVTWCCITICLILAQQVRSFRKSSDSRSRKAHLSDRTLLNLITPVLMGIGLIVGKFFYPPIATSRFSLHFVWECKERNARVRNNRDINHEKNRCKSRESGRRLPGFLICFWFNFLNNAGTNDSNKLIELVKGYRIIVLFLLYILCQAKSR